MLGVGRALSIAPHAPPWVDLRLGKQKFGWWNLEPQAAVPPIDSDPGATPLGAGLMEPDRLLTRSGAASGWVGSAVPSYFPYFIMTQNCPFRLMTLVRTTVWARLVPSR